MVAQANWNRWLSRRAGVFLLLFSLLALALAPLGSRAVAAPACTDNLSPDGRIAVANNNVEERSPGDMDNHADMNYFIARLINGVDDAKGHQIKYTPDVVLLQEVRTKSASYIAGRLGDVTGCKFGIVISSDWYAHQRRGRAVFRETAILINTDTMEQLGQKGYIVSKYTQAQANPSLKRAFKSHAYAMAKEKTTGITISLASVHLAKDNSLKDMATAKSLKTRWSNEIAQNIKNKFGDADDMSVIAGDFNHNRCDDPTYPCSPEAFWKTLVDKWNYKDARWVIEEFGRYIDYIFGKPNVHAADEDDKYDQHRDKFYSDHQFRWAVVELQDDTAPTNFKIESAEGYGPKPGRGGLVQLSWSQSFDGGSGLKPYRVLHSKGDAGGGCEPNFTLADDGLTRKLTWQSTDEDRGSIHCFRVEVSDESGHTTRATISSAFKSKTPSAVKVIGDDTVRIIAGGL